MTQPEYDINDLFQEAQSRWLKPAEVFFILQNYEKYKLSQECPHKPISGSLFLFNKRVLRFFRKDGHSWRRKKDGRAIAEAHERLKVGNAEALSCYYAHGEEDPNFQRRSYWMLDSAYEHIVLVHYRDTSARKLSPGYNTQRSPSSSRFGPSPSSFGTYIPSSSVISNSYELHQNISSPCSVEVSFDVPIKEVGVATPGSFSSSTKFEVKEAFRRLEEQLSLNEDSFKEVDPSYCQDENTYDPELEYGREISAYDQFALIEDGPEKIGQEQYSDRYAEMRDHSDNLVVLNTDSGNDTKYKLEELRSLKEMLESFNDSLCPNFQDNLPSSSEEAWSKPQQSSPWLYFNGSNVDLSQELSNGKLPAYSCAMEFQTTNSDYDTMFLDQGSNGISFKSDVSLTVAQRLKFTINEVSPEWGYAAEETKVIIVGSFLCDPSESTWRCMFGDIEVPLQIIQEGVLQCTSPPHLPAKVTLCITSGNRESCSETREFEYRDNTSTCTGCNLAQTEASKSTEELLLLVRFVQMLLSDSARQIGDCTQSEYYPFMKLKADDNSWNQVIEALLVGSRSSSGTSEWLLQVLLKNALQQWLSSKSKVRHDQTGCSLSKKEQGIIHMVGGLGFVWALNPILSCGVKIDFRDINGWTALHWAARSGREKMVAALLASGASAGAVTDPRAQDPTGETPASLAASSGHKGLAGYLSEVALTSHLSSLTLVESEGSKGSAEIEADMAVNSILRSSLTNGEDQLSLKDTLDAVRNAAQAAARIQSAFRAHSFRKRQQSEDATASIDEYGIHSDDIQGISAISKMTFGHARAYSSAALSIQKKYRGWKGRKDFLALRQKVVKIQAHVRGYQVRRHYKVICWAVGVLDKVVLRWRRKGVGLRGFRQESEPTDDSEDEDVLKVFRKQKVGAALDEAVSRVLSMVDSPDARQQYRRMLEKYRKAKADLVETSSTNSADDIFDMDKDGFNEFQ